MYKGLLKWIYKRFQKGLLQGLFIRIYKRFLIGLLEVEGAEFGGSGGRRAVGLQVAQLGLEVIMSTALDTKPNDPPSKVA